MTEILTGMRKRRRRLDAIECLAVLSYWTILGGMILFAFGVPVLIYMLRE